MDANIQVLGFYVERAPDGRQAIVLVQPYVGPDGTQETREHAADSPEALWEAFAAIAADPGQRPQVEPADDDEPFMGFSGHGGGAYGQDDEPMTPRDHIMRIGLDGAANLIGSAMGPTAGRLAEAVFRNPQHVRAAGQRVAATIRNMSRGERPPRAKRW